MTTPATITAIPHVDAMDPAEFAQRYVAQCVPVVLSGATGRWPALTKWSHSWFKEAFGDRLVSVSFDGPLSGNREVMALGDYLHDIARPAGNIQPYLRLERLPGVFPELHEDFTTPPYCPPGRTVTVHLWIGPEKTVQPFHKDNRNPLSPVHNLLVQVWGRKLVSLVSADQDEKMYRHPTGSAHPNYSQVDYLRPDLERFPLFGEARIAETVVEPGEMVFIPAGTWHHVQSLQPSISLSFWWYQTAIADVVATLASLADDSATHPSPLGSGPLIDVQDVDEFGGIWALALATRTLPAERRRLLVDACTEPVAVALRAAQDRLG